jgi:signal peptide peptidase SppA
MVNLPSALSDRLPDRLSGHHGPVVTVVRLHGVIAAGAVGPGRSPLNAETLEGPLERAFSTPGVQAVALSINSPGGSPTQSTLVGDRIRQLAAEHEVPVLAFCEDVAASGGYWLACAADEIIATPTSLLGSVGVVSSGFGLEGLIDKLGVERRLHTQGTNKSRLDPFSPEKAEDVDWLLRMQESVHAEFKAWVRQRRGTTLVGTDDELFTGEVWTGRRAVELGLADSLGTLRGVLAERYPGADVRTTSRSKSLAARLGLPGAAASVAGSLLAVAEDRAAWARFGL